MKRVLAWCAIAAFAAPAAADSVDLTYAGRGLGWGHKITFDGVSTNNVFTGELMHEFSGAAGPMSGLNDRILATFSTEIGQSVARSAGTYDAVELAALGMGEQRARAVRGVFAYAGTIGTTSLADAKNLAAATQLVIWEIVYEPDDGTGGLGAIDITAGRLSATQTRGDRPLSNGIMRHFNTLRSHGVGFGESGSLVGLGSPDHQDQLLTMVPLPSGVCLGLAGLGLVGLKRRR